MKHLRLFEQLKYSQNIYYKSQLDKAMDKEWSEISTTRDTIKFDASTTEDGYTYSVFFKRGYSEDKYYLEEIAIPKFIEKFKKEFSKNPEKYIKNFKYDPKCLGDDLGIYRDTEKYNL